MNLPENIEELLHSLPDVNGARRFLTELESRNPSDANRLVRDNSLLSDILTLASYSPLLATTALQNPQYIWWLKNQRSGTTVHSKDEILESLGRFSLTNTQLEPNVLFARIRRRELMRIYLRDIRRLGTIAEITEEISNLADAILEHALGLGVQEMDNRYGQPMVTDEKGRSKRSGFCILSLGKLGSYELNYSSDIDLCFIYSDDGNTTGQGRHGSVTNREYFVKLAEYVIRTVGQQSGEGAAYRVDLRLRPFGRVGALSVSLSEAVSYYQTKAQAWELQTLIRSRASAGDRQIYKQFYNALESKIYPNDVTVEDALKNVRLSKEKIDLHHSSSNGYNVKLGKGGIREIEFIAQALQLAYGGRDQWIRTPHTLISLGRLADHGLLSESELTALSDSYDFLRRLEHRIQMEHGLQTHLVSDGVEKRALIAGYMNISSLLEFNKTLKFHTSKTHDIFQRVFGDAAANSPQPHLLNNDFKIGKRSTTYKGALAGSAIAHNASNLNPVKQQRLIDFSSVTAPFSELVAAKPDLADVILHDIDGAFAKNYSDVLHDAVIKSNDLKVRFNGLRNAWSREILEIAALDAFRQIDRFESKKRQTQLAEASLTTALFITEHEMATRYPYKGTFNLFALGLGKIGGAGMDYGSDLDVILLYDDENPINLKDISLQEFYSEAAEIFVSSLSNFTRSGSLYRVDLRLRPDGKNGPNAISHSAFLQYLENRSAIWEWLAYVKLRGVAGNTNLTQLTESESRNIIHRKAHDTSADELRVETVRIRKLLEDQKGGRAKNLDIKYGPGGMLDIYFLMRFLQLANNIPDDPSNRSTGFMLKRLYECKALTRKAYDVLSQGYDFLSEFDHNLRLVVGRTNGIPTANPRALNIISGRMNLKSSRLLETLALHRINIRDAFDTLMK